MPKSDLIRIKKAIESKLLTNPGKFGKPLRNTLKNYRSLRVGNYRIGFRIEDKQLIVLVIKIGLRKSIYDEMKKRLGI